MSFRSLALAAALGSLAFGCMASDEADKGAPDALGAVAVLRVEGPSELVAVTGGMVEARVQLVGPDGQPVAGQTIDFGLLGAAPGASLASLSSVTDAGGYASAQVVAGSTTATFELRVSASGAAPLRIQVRVEQGYQLTASVDVRYTGQRALAARNVTLVLDGKCADLAETSVLKQNLRGAPSMVLLADSERASFMLRPEQPYAAVAWGSDDTNSKLAYGCVEFVAGSRTSEAERAEQVIEIPLSDTALALQPGSYEVLLSLDFHEPLALLNGVVRNAVNARLGAQPNAEARLYVDALGLMLAPATRDALLSSLSARLQNSGTGPLCFADQVAARVATRGEQASVHAALIVEPEAQRLRVHRLYAVGPDGQASNQGLNTAALLSLEQAGLASESVVQAAFDVERASMDFERLTLRFGLGSYASQVLGSLGSASQLAGSLPGSGCAQLQATLKEQALAISEAEAKSRCEQQLVLLLGDIQKAIGELDATRPGVELKGSVPVHDRDEDGAVDDFGPSQLTGAWGESGESSAVGATLEVPPATTLAL